MKDAGFRTVVVNLHDDLVRDIQAALYLLWVASWLTTYRLVTRIRSIAEHGMVPDNLDPPLARTGHVPGLA